MTDDEIKTLFQALQMQVNNLTKRVERLEKNDSLYAKLWKITIELLENY